jgi:SAM-dependent methyltransferase
LHPVLLAERPSGTTWHPFGKKLQGCPGNDQACIDSESGRAGSFAGGDIHLNGATVKEKMSNCMVCKAPATFKLQWSAADIASAYRAGFDLELAGKANPVDYRIFRCGRCQLGFSEPAVSGNSDFYAFVTQLPNYYQENRWEWGVLAERFNRDSRSFKLLEIGCGTGNFLREMQALENVDAIGIDTHQASVSEALEKKVNAYCLSLEEFTSSYPDQRFQVVCAFHCLEHVESPVALMKAAMSVLSPDGVVVISVPYTSPAPGSISRDPMNLPPHHLTQWCQTSLEALADAVDATVEVHTENSKTGQTVLQSVYWHFLSSMEPGGSPPKYPGFMQVLRSPGRFAESLRHILARDRVDGSVAGNVAFAIFSPVGP